MAPNSVMGRRVNVDPIGLIMLTGTRLVILANEGNEADFRKCVQNRECAESTVKAYIARYTKDCNDDGMIDCIDYAALHKGGPSECSKNWV